jgi:hypothetical protein
LMLRSGVRDYLCELSCTTKRAMLPSTTTLCPGRLAGADGSQGSVVAAETRHSNRNVQNRLAHGSRQ